MTNVPVMPKISVPCMLSVHFSCAHRAMHVSLGRREERLYLRNNQRRQAAAVTLLLQWQPVGRSAETASRSNRALSRSERAISWQQAQRLAMSAAQQTTTTTSELQSQQLVAGTTQASMPGLAQSRASGRAAACYATGDLARCRTWDRSSCTAWSDCSRQHMLGRQPQSESADSRPDKAHSAGADSCSAGPVASQSVPEPELTRSALRQQAEAAAAVGRAGRQPSIRRQLLGQPTQAANG